MNLFSRSKPRAEAPVRGSVLTLPLLKPAGDGAPAYIIPRVRRVEDGVVTHLDNALRRFQRIVLVAGPGMGKSAALAFAAAQSDRAGSNAAVPSFADFHPQALPTAWPGTWILFDDLSTPAHTAHLQTLAAKFPDAHCVTATTDAKLAPEGFIVLALNALNEREIVALAEAWFPLPPERGHGARLNRAAQDFVASVQASAGARELALTPLYLFLLLQVYQPSNAPAGGAARDKVALPMVGGNAATPFDVPQRTNVSPLPARRTELFQQYVNAKLAGESDPEFAARALEGIALSTKRGQRPAQDHLARGYDFLRERPGGRIEFKHALIQDFLAARALRRNPDPAPMLEHLADAAWREVALFYAGLGGAETIAQAAFERGDPAFAAEALAATAEPNPDLLERVVKQLAGRAWDDHEERAVLALGVLRSNPASDFFAAKLRDKNPEVRLRAASILGGLHTDRALEYLLPQLRDPSPEVRDQVIASLGASRSERVVEPLLVALRGDPRVASSETRMKIAAARALGEYGTDKAVPALIVDLQVSDPEVRAQAIMALEKIRSGFAVKPLEAIAAADMRPEARTAAAQVLQDMRGG